MRKLLTTILMTALLLGGVVPLAVSAQTTGSEPAAAPATTKTNDAKKKPIALDNPLTIGGKDVDSTVNLIDSVEVGLGNILQIMFGLLAVLSVIPMVIGGIQFIVSQGGTQGSGRVTTAKQTIYWGIIGLISGLLGIVVINAVLRIVEISS